MGGCVRWVAGLFGGRGGTHVCVRMYEKRRRAERGVGRRRRRDVPLALWRTS